MLRAKVGTLATAGTVTLLSVACATTQHDRVPGPSRPAAGGGGDEDPASRSPDARDAGLLRAGRDAGDTDDSEVSGDATPPVDGPTTPTGDAGVWSRDAKSTPGDREYCGYPSLGVQRIDAATAPWVMVRMINAQFERDRGDGALGRRARLDASIPFVALAGDRDDLASRRGRSLHKPALVVTPNARHFRSDPRAITFPARGSRAARRRTGGSRRVESSAGRRSCHSRGAAGS